MTPVLAAERSSNFVDVAVHNWQWMLLLGLIVGLLLIDLLVFHREAHEVSTKEAAIESAVWISIGVAFTFVVIGGGSVAPPAASTSRATSSRRASASTTCSCGR